MHQTGPSAEMSVCVFCLPSRRCGFSRGYRVIVYSKLTATCALPLIWSSVMADTHSQLSKMAASTRMTVRLLFSLRGDWNVRIREPSERERERDGCVFSRSVSLQAVFLVVSEAWRMCVAPPLLPLLFLPPRTRLIGRRDRNGNIIRFRLLRGQRPLWTL